MVQIVVMKGLTMSYRELGQSGSTKNFYIANKWYVQVSYKISSFTFNSNRSQMSWMKLMLFWLPKKWWSRSHATKPSLNAVVSAIDDAGLPARPKKNCTLREMMAHVGNRLVEEKRVTLNRAAGLTIYCSACIAALWFVVERFWETNFFCAKYLHAGLGTRRQERPGTRRSTTLLRCTNVVKCECNDCILLPFMPRVTLKFDVFLYCKYVVIHSTIYNHCEKYNRSKSTILLYFK